MENKELVVKFEGNKTTNGDYVKALAKYFIDYGITGDWILEQALKIVKEKNKEINDFRTKIIAGVK